MNSFIPENPTVVLQVSADGTAIVRSANNIDRDITIVLVPDKDTFDDKALNQPFKLDHQPDPARSFIGGVQSTLCRQGLTAHDKVDPRGLLEQ